MLADDDMQRMYILAHGLHPHPEIALAVTAEACERLALLHRQQAQGPPRTWLRLPESWWPQYCVYLASEAHERAQERQRPDPSARQRPTPDEALVHYLKCLVWWTLDHTACHVAVALGCFLYRYQPGDLMRLAPALCDPAHILRIRARLAHQLDTRFPRAHLFAGDHGTGRTRLPSAHDRQLIRDALAQFTPWGAAHVPAPALDRSLLATHFHSASRRSDWDRRHALINPVDAGLPRLIREYNQPLTAESALRLADPDAMLAIPRFPT